MSWIVQSVTIQANAHLQPVVAGHFLIADETREDAVAIVRRTMGGGAYVSVVGFVQNGRTHYFPARHA